MAQGNACCFQQTCKCTVQRINTMAGFVLARAHFFGWSYSNSSPRPLDWFSLLACLPSILSIVEYLTGQHCNIGNLRLDYIHKPKAKLKYTQDGAYCGQLHRQFLCNASILVQQDPAQRLPRLQHWPGRMKIRSMSPYWAPAIEGEAVPQHSTIASISIRVDINSATPT